VARIIIAGAHDRAGYGTDEHRVNDFVRATAAGPRVATAAGPQVATAAGPQVATALRSPGST